MAKAYSTYKTYSVGSDQFEKWAATNYWKDPRYKGNVTAYYKRELVEEFLRKLIVEDKKPWTIRTYLNGIRFMAREYGVPLEISDDIAPPIREEIPIFVTKEEVEFLLNNIWDKQYKALIALLWDTAIRISEALALNVNDVSFKDNTITLSKRKGSYVPYVIPFCERTAEILTDYIEEWKIKIGYPLFPGRRSERLSETTAIREIRDYGEIYLNKRITSHSFRHGRAIMLRKEGIDITEIADLLGHKRLETTRRYARITGVHLKNLPKAF